VTGVASRALTIRPATEADLDRIALIERASFSDPWTRDALATALRLSHIRFLAAASSSESRDGEVELAGYVVALVMGDEGEIADLAVAPSARRRGVGGLLLDRTARELAECGVRTLYLEVRESNLAALALYRSRGFQQVGRRRAYYRHPPEDALVLRCELDHT
jgi:[ribosomal protein S18]-alanine N-acetyltransferase